MNKYFRIKSVESLIAESKREGEGELKKTLGATSLIMLGIGAIIGAGLFSITGIAAGQFAGPAITISFVIAGVACAFAGLCYAEFASMIPVAGSAYTYSFATMGELFAWIIGWDLVLEYAVGAATVAISWSNYLVKFLANFGIDLPPALVTSPFEGGFINLPAILVVVMVSLVLGRGIKESARMTTLIVMLKLFVVFAFIILGWNYINPENYTPYIVENTGNFGEYGWSGIIRAAGLVFFAYIGFDAVSTAAQETINPKKNMPIGILGSLVICTILYILFAHVMTGLAHYTEFNAEGSSLAPVATAIANTPYKWLNQSIIFAILAGYISVILVMLLGQSRVFYSMSKDGLIPKVFSEIHPKFQTPFKSNMLFMIFVSLFAGFVPGHVVGEMTSIGTLFAFILVCMGILILRKKSPDVERGFKVPLVPLIPALGVLVCLGLMVFLTWDTWVRLIVWIAIGMVIYFVYGRHNSKLNK